MTVSTVTPARCLRDAAAVDEELDRSRAALSQGNEAVESTRKDLAAAEAALAAAEAALQAAKAKVHEAEQDIAHHDARRVKEEKRMDNIRNVKEQKAVEKELGMIAAKKEKAEARALEAIQAVEAAEKAIVERRTAAEAARAAAAAAAAEADARRAAISGAAAELEARRAEVVAALPQAFRSHYDLLRQRNLAPISDLDGEACGTCRRKQPQNIVLQVRVGKAPRCGGCARFLLPPPPSVPAASADPSA